MGGLMNLSGQIEWLKKMEVCLKKVGNKLLFPFFCWASYKSFSFSGVYVYTSEN